MNETVKRAIWGALFVAIVIGGFLVGQYLPILILGTFMIIGVVEFYRFFDKSRKVQPPFYLGLIGAVLLYTLLVLHDLQLYRSDMYMALIPLLFAPLLYVVISKTRNPLLDVAVMTFSWLYVVLPFFMMYKIYSFNRIYFDSQYLIIGFFVLVWTNDTFAYLIGKSIGKRKLIERISPKKTWEGTIGGIGMAILISLLVAINTNNDFVFWAIAALIVAPTAVLGDLIESKFKRIVKIKDSGNVFPGHGGILDRFDAAIYAAPFFYLFLKLYYS